MSQKIQINGLTFELYKLPMLKRIVLDRKVAKMLLPLSSGIGNLTATDLAKVLSPAMSAEDTAVLESELSDKIDLEGITSAIGRVLAELSDAEFKQLVLDLFQTTSCTHPRHGAVLMDSETALNTVLDDLSPMDVYRLAIEVMRENNFTPFVLSGGGGGILGTVGSVVGKVAGKKRGVKLERSGTSTT